MRLVFGLLIFLFSSLTFANRVGLSPARHPHETHMEAYLRNSVMTSSLSRLPQRLSKPLKSLDITKIPNIGSKNDLVNQFEYIRDLRFLEGQERGFLRRLAWLYPDDGCYARAEMAAYLLTEKKFVIPKKIFVFGNLRASTSNTRTGRVEWWYHVAVTYRVADTAYVFDPAIDPLAPMTLESWNKAVGGDRSNVTFTICNAATYDPNDDCEAKGDVEYSDAMSQQQTFLFQEWARLLELRRHPEQELGEFPPWKK